MLRDYGTKDGGAALRVQTKQDQLICLNTLKYILDLSTTCITNTQPLRILFGSPLCSEQACPCFSQLHWRNL